MTNEMQEGAVVAAPSSSPAAAPPAGSLGTSTRAKLKAASAQAAIKLVERVPFPDLGLTIVVRPMMGAALTRLGVEGYSARRQQRGPDRGKLTHRIVTDRYCAIVIQETSHDEESDALIWRSEESDEAELEAGLAEIRALPPDVFTALFNAGMRVSGLTKAANDALGEGSSETDTDGPSSASLKNSEAAPSVS